MEKMPPQYENKTRTTILNDSTKIRFPRFNPIAKRVLPSRSDCPILVPCPCRRPCRHRSFPFCDVTVKCYICVSLCVSRGFVNSLVAAETASPFQLTLHCCGPLPAINSIFVDLEWSGESKP